MLPLVQLVAFEGPDRYSFVGGLATRMNDLAEALVDRGYTVRHLFVGDPDLPHEEDRAGGKLRLERWAQWISSYHPRDVYDGEIGKWRDFGRTVPPHLVEDVIVPAAERGQHTVVLFEDWQTADAAIATALLLTMREHRSSASLFWNANNTYGFDAVDFASLEQATTITTVSRFMRAALAEVGVDAAVLPNGIAERWLRPVAPSDIRAVKASFGDRPTFVKVARFDPDKRWDWAVDAVAAMKAAGLRPRLVVRGSRADHAQEVWARVARRGLSVDSLRIAPDAPVPAVTRAIAASASDVVHLDFFVSERALRALYAAADGVLANSTKEPFGLVGLEVMACGGIAYLGRTGEDYAVPYGNCVVVQTDDPRELGSHLAFLAERKEVASRIRTEGKTTAKRFAWPRIVDALEVTWEAVARLGK
ncbi:MAG: glycosyltransferase family 4 protein [Chloroflexota bacterium]|nr:glycosyltransferase family 4 protein [Chloroflexota bacterium]